eukprot:7132132-Prymnesium_polylepis.1
MPNASASNRCAPATNPPWRMHCCCFADKSELSFIVCSLHRITGTWPIALPAPCCMRSRARLLSHPPGHRPTTEATPRLGFDVVGCKTARAGHAQSAASSTP